MSFLFLRALPVSCVLTVLYKQRCLVFPFSRRRFRVTDGVLYHTERLTPDKDKMSLCIYNHSLKKMGVGLQHAMCMKAEFRPKQLESCEKTHVGGQFLSFLFWPQ